MKSVFKNSNLFKNEYKIENKKYEKTLYSKLKRNIINLDGNKIEKLKKIYSQTELPENLSDINKYFIEIKKIADSNNNAINDELLLDYGKIMEVNLSYLIVFVKKFHDNPDSLRENIEHFYNDEIGQLLIIYLDNFYCLGMPDIFDLILCYLTKCAKLSSENKVSLINLNILKSVLFILSGKFHNILSEITINYCFKLIANLIIVNEEYLFENNIYLNDSLFKDLVEIAICCFTRINFNSKKNAEYYILVTLYRIIELGRNEVLKFIFQHKNLISSILDKLINFNKSFLILKICELLKILMTKHIEENLQNDSLIDSIMNYQIRVLYIIKKEVNNDTEDKDICINIIHEILNFYILITDSNNSEFLQKLFESEIFDKLITLDTNIDDSLTKKFHTFYFLLLRNLSIFINHCQLNLIEELCKYNKISEFFKIIFSANGEINNFHQDKYDIKIRIIQDLKNKKDDNINIIKEFPYLCKAIFETRSQQ